MTSLELTDNYASMILGVRNAPSLRQPEKDFIIEMLEDQLRIELQCLEFYEPVRVPGVSV